MVYGMGITLQHSQIFIFSLKLVEVHKDPLVVTLLVVPYSRLEPFNSIFLCKSKIQTICVRLM